MSRSLGHYLHKYKTEKKSKSHDSDNDEDCDGGLKELLAFASSSSPPSSSSLVPSSYQGLFGALFHTTDGFVLVPQSMQIHSKATQPPFNEDKHYPALKIGVKTQHVHSEIEISWLPKRDAPLNGDSIPAFRCCEGQLFKLSKKPEDEYAVLQLFQVDHAPPSSLLLKERSATGMFRVSFVRDMNHPHSFQSWMSQKCGVTLDMKGVVSKVHEAIPPVESLTVNREKAVEEKLPLTVCSHAATIKYKPLPVIMPNCDYPGNKENRSKRNDSNDRDGVVAKPASGGENGDDDQDDFQTIPSAEAC